MINGSGSGCFCRVVPGNHCPSQRWQRSAVSGGQLCCASSVDCWVLVTRAARSTLWADGQYRVWLTRFAAVDMEWRYGVGQARLCEGVTEAAAKGCSETKHRRQVRWAWRGCSVGRVEGCIGADVGTVSLPSCWSKMSWVPLQFVYIGVL